MKVQKAFVYDVIPKPLPALTDLAVCIRRQGAALADILLP